MSWDEGLPLGNGLLGALVWGNGRPMNISLDRTDLWDLRPVPEYFSEEYSYALMRQWEKERRIDDLKRVYEEPYRRFGPTKIPAGRIELSFEPEVEFRCAGLTLADACGRFQLGGDIAATVYIHATIPVGLISVSGCHSVAARFKRSEPTSRSDEGAKQASGIGRISDLGYPCPEFRSGTNWIGYQQDGWEGFRFAVCLLWENVLQKGEAWRAVWTVTTSQESADPLALALERAQSVLAKDPMELNRAHSSWWEDYWSKSKVHVPNPVIEKQWYLDTYKFGAASRRGSPPITLQGPWTADNGRLPPWKGDYHHDLNTQLSYWSCYASNHLDEGLSFLDWLWETRDVCRAWSERFFSLPGLNVPMTADLNNNQMGGWRQYTHSATTGAWLAHHFYMHWKFSMDSQFLEERAFPYIRECAVFIEAITLERDENGYRTLPLSSSPEINHNLPEAWFPTITNYDLSLITWLLSAASELATELGQCDESAHWKEVLSEFPRLSLGDQGQLLVAGGTPLASSHRHFSHLMAIQPLNLIDWSHGHEDQEIITASLRDLDRLGTEQWTGYSFAWLANLASRARDGKRAEQALEIFASAFTLRNSFHCNGDQSGKGYSKYVYRPVSLEGNFASAAGLQEMLLQSHTGVIDQFPAIPDEWQDVSFSHLRAQGAFLVSAERRDGKLVFFEVTSEVGGVCRIRSPENGKLLEFKLEPKQTIHIT